MTWLLIELHQRLLTFAYLLDNERVSEYELKLMDIDQEHLSIPETDYEATIVMSSAEFQRICRDLMVISESGIKKYII